MRIKKSCLLGQNKNIEFYQTSLIAKEGPNIVGKLPLDDLSIEYESVFTTKQILKKSQGDTPIMYGHLGTDITLLVIKPTYGQCDPMSCTGTSQYIEYYFEDEPLIRRTMTNLLVLSGNESNRIPQVYLYNPTDYDVTLDIMAANIGENTISTSVVPTSTDIKGLSFNSITSDQIYSSTYTGSTQFEILDINDNVQMAISYNNIDIINIDDDILTINTTYDDPIKLYFNSTFNSQQALSRMNWLMEQSINRYATSTSPGLDTTAPTITFKPHSDPQPMDYTSGIVSKSDIRWRFIDNVKDYDDAGNLRDGIINTSDVNLLIIDDKNGEQLSAITYDGNYSVTFTAKDLANNSVSSTKGVVVDETGPTIYYTTGKTINEMDLTGDTQTPGTILKDDLRRYYINYVWDDVDGIIANSAVTIDITSGSTTYNEITEIGTFDIDFSVSDISSNTTTGNTTLSVIESVPPVIDWIDSVFTNTAFTMSLSADTVSTSAITVDDIRNYTITSVTDNYDGNIDISEVTVTGTSFAIYVTGDYDITFNVSDSSGNETTAERVLTVKN